MPPTRSSDHARSRLLDLATGDLFADLSPVVEATSDAIRSVVRQTVPPDAVEIFTHGALGYGPSRSAHDRLLYISPQRTHVNLGFFWGAALPDPLGLIEGSGSRMRHVKLRDVTTARSRGVADLVMAGWRAGMAGLTERKKQRAEQGQ